MVDEAVVDEAGEIEAYRTQVAGYTKAQIVSEVRKLKNMLKDQRAKENDAYNEYQRELRKRRILENKIRVLKDRWNEILDEV